MDPPRAIFFPPDNVINEHVHSGDAPPSKKITYRSSLCVLVCVHRSCWSENEETKKSLELLKAAPDYPTPACY